MIISCEQCRAQFRLDDSKVPEGGARVRCSKCNHAFFIAPPGQADELQAESLAREALERGPTPEAEESESDWQFNEDSGPGLAPTAPGLKAARDAVDDLLGDLARSVSVGPRTFEPEPEPEPEPEAEPDAAPEPAQASDTETQASDALEPEAAAPAPAPELGSPEGWNFFEDAEDPEPEEGEAIGLLALMPRWKLLEQELEEAERAIEARAAAADLDDRGSAAVRRWLGLLGNGAGWVATLALLAAGAWALASGPTPRVAPAPAALEVGGFRAEELRGRWVENALGGPLFVVSGRLRPVPGTLRPVEGPLAVRLLDAGGEPLASATSPVGPPFPQQVLRERDPQELRAAQARAAPQFARLHPGESAPFEALFAQVPPGAARFALEVGP